MLGLCFCARAFSSCGKWGPLFIAVRGPLTIVASLVAEHRLQTRRLSSCGSRAQLLRSMWDLPRPGPEPASPALAGRLSTTAPPGKPPKWIFISYNFDQLIVLPRGSKTYNPSWYPSHDSSRLSSFLLFSRRQYTLIPPLFPGWVALPGIGGLWVDIETCILGVGVPLKAVSFSSLFLREAHTWWSLCAFPGPPVMSHSCVSGAHPHSACFMYHCIFFQWELRKGWITWHWLITIISHNAFQILA